MQPGEEVAGRFTLEQRVGAGGMGVVWRAHDAVTSEPVALKVVKAGAPRERFAREATLLGSLEHPHIVSYVAHGALADGSPYLAMEWLDGEGLEERLARGPLDVDVALRLGARVADALASTHDRGVIHRDLKPANLFLPGGVAEEPKVLDFGIARWSEGAALRTRTGVMMGTLGYMAPEQARGRRDIDGRADVFSLGCVLFECVTGRPMFVGENAVAILAKIIFDDPPPLGDLCADAPAELESLVSRMVAKDPERRPATMGEVSTLLDSLVGRSARRAEPSARASSPLTDREQRLVAVVLRSVADASAPTLVAEDPASAATLAPGHGELDAAVRDAVRDHGARLERLAGGALALLIPSEGSPTDLAARAAACGLALRDGSTPIAMAIGRAEMGARGPAGAAIDRASSLLARSRGALFTDAATRALLGGGFRCETRGDAAVVVARQHDEGVRTLLGRSTPCVGRERWLAGLDALFSEAMDDPGARAAVIVAPAGTGKSRLRHELLKRIRARAPRLEIWSARGDVAGAGSAFGLAAQMVKQAAGLAEVAPEARAERLAARVAAHVRPDARRRVSAFLSWMIRAPHAGDEDPLLEEARRDPGLMGEQLRRAWLDLLDAETEDHPMALVLEDLHLGDEPTVSLMNEALGRLAERPLFVLAAGRPELDTRFSDLWESHDVMRIDLPALPKSGARELARHALGDAGEDVERVVRQAGGNVFFLEELIRAVAEGRGERLPDTVLATVEARLSRLGRLERKVLRAASVFGMVAPTEGVRALAGDDASDALAALEEGELVDRLGGVDGELAFRNAVVRDAAYAMLVDDERSLGHRLAADWLEARGGEPSAVADHLERGGETERAAAAYVDAAQRALEGNDLTSAIRLGERGVACGASGEVLGRLRLAQATAHRWRGDHRDALDRAEEALSLLERGAELWGRAAGEVTRAAGTLGDIDRTSAVADELLEAARRGDPSDGVLFGIAGAAHRLSIAGRAREARALIEAASASGRDLPPAVRATMSVAMRLSGDLVGYLDCQRAAAAASAARGADRSALVARVNIGSGLVDLGALGEAEEILISALEEADRLELDQLTAYARLMLGVCRLRRGRLEEALRDEDAAVEVFRRYGDAVTEGMGRAYRASIRLETGDVDGAERDARSAVELLEARAPTLRPYSLGVPRAGAAGRRRRRRSARAGRPGGRSPRRAG